MGTRITYLSKGNNPDGDNRINLKGLPGIDSKKVFSKSNSKLEYVFVTDHEMYAVNKLKYKGKYFLLKEPNPVTFYYSLAYDVVPQLDEAKALLESLLNAKVTDEHSNRKKAMAYSYVFKVSSVGIIFSFLALEAFLNQQLPDIEEIQYNGKMYSKKKLQSASFGEKISKIIPQLDGRNFIELYPRKAIIIDRLKTLRNELTHLKQKQGNGMSAYDEIYQDILALDLQKTVNTVKSFINFYHPKLIQNYKTPLQRSSQ